VLLFIFANKLLSLIDLDIEYFRLKLYNLPYLGSRLHDELHFMCDLLSLNS